MRLSLGLQSWVNGQVQVNRGGISFASHCTVLCCIELSRDQEHRIANSLRVDRFMLEMNIDEHPPPPTFQIFLLWCSRL
jgi:hypothetical protein